MPMADCISKSDMTETPGMIHPEEISSPVYETREVMHFQNTVLPKHNDGTGIE